MSLMVAVVVDANVLIAARLSRDQNHERGEAIAQAMDRGTLPTAYVLSDVLEEDHQLSPSESWARCR